MGVWALGWAMACGQPADAELYRQALSQPWERGLETCRALRETVAASDCWVAVLDGAVRDGEEVRPVLRHCAELDEPFWRDECAFELVDAAGLTGAGARSACDRAGRFLEQCNMHAYMRELAAVDVALSEPGMEAALGRAYRDVLEPYASALEGQDLGRTVALQVDKTVGKRFKDGVLAPQRCGAVGLGRCGRVVARHLVRDRGGGLLEACSRPLTREELVLAALPVWPSGDSGLGLVVWREICAGT